MRDAQNILNVTDLRVWFGDHQNPIRAVDGVDFSIGEADTVALVGESGCGKSVTALSLARLVPEPPALYKSGSIFFAGRDVLTMNQKQLRSLRGGEIAYIFQEPSSSLNPVFRVGAQIAEAILLHRKNVDVKAEALGLMKLVGLPDPERRYNSYPHELSGGMQQRIMIAMALACRPKLLVADEPTTALDVTIQAQILDLLKSLQKELKMAVLMITHNLGLVADIAVKVCVMYAGHIVESGATASVLKSPAHPYTALLLEAAPRLSGSRDELKGISGAVPSPSKLPEGCRFHPRCPYAKDKCRTTEPPLTRFGAVNMERTVRCHYPLRQTEEAGN